MTHSDYWTTEAMKVRGGSFVRLVGELARAADPINLSIIKKAWPVYWTMYESIGAELRKKRDCDCQHNLNDLDKLV